MAFGSLRALGETQLQIQFTRSSMYDTQALGILALNAALVAAVIAAKDLIGHLWCLSLIGFVLSSIPSMGALGYIGLRGQEGFGPNVKPLLVPARTLSTADMDKVLASSLADAIVDNDLHLRNKRRRVGFSVALLILTIASIVFSALAF